MLVIYIDFNSALLLMTNLLVFATAYLQYKNEIRRRN